jgi:hypothetical protein
MSIARNGESLPPLTLSNLLAGGQIGHKVVESIVSDAFLIDYWIAEKTSLPDLIHNPENYYEDGFVYLFWAEETNFFKVGKSISPQRRIREVYPKMPFKTRLVGYIKTNCMSLLENIYHYNYFSYRANGEWFELPPRIINEWRIKISDSEPETLESLVGRTLSVMSPDDTWEWVHRNFQMDSGKGFMSAFFDVAVEIASLYKIQGKVSARMQRN